MPLTPQGIFTFLHTNQADTPNVAPATLKAQWDTQASELKTTFNNLIIALEKTTLTSGAEQIGSLAIADLTGTTIHAQLLSLRNQLKSIVDGFSGADFIAATAIAGLTGGTVQALLEALKAYTDLKDTAQTSALTTHKTSSDHDGRYFTETELQSIVDANSGADKVGATAITDLTGTTVQAILESLRNTLKSIVDGFSGADFVNSTAITGVTGTTVQSQLESIKSLIDLIYTKAQLDAGQLDNRYFTETELQAITDTTSGADKIGATLVSTGSGTTVQGILEWLYQQIVTVTLGSIPDGSLTDVKLSDTAGQIKDRVASHLVNTSNPHVVTKTQVGLGSVDNLQQATKVEFNAHVAEFTQHVPYGGTTTGTANAHVATLSPALTAYVAGVGLSVKIGITNTGASTINVNGLGVKSILDSKGAALTAGKLTLNSIVTLRYNGTAFILQGEGGDYGTAGAAQVLNTHTVGTPTGVVAGTIPIVAGGNTITPSTVNQTAIPANTYTTSAITVLGDADLVASNILNTANIFNVQGTAISAKSQSNEVGVPITYTSNGTGATAPFSVTGVGFQGTQLSMGIGGMQSTDPTQGSFTGVITAGLFTKNGRVDAGSPNKFLSIVISSITFTADGFSGVVTVTSNHTSFTTLNTTFTYFVS